MMTFVTLGADSETVFPIQITKKASVELPYEILVGLNYGTL